MSTEKEKTGVFTGAYAINPVNDARIPIWIADYVLMSYGTGAIMAVPGHDERDHEFAREFGLPIVEVVAGSDRPIEEAAYVDSEEGVLVNSTGNDAFAVTCVGKRPNRPLGGGFIVPGDRPAVCSNSHDVALAVANCDFSAIRSYIH